MSTTPTLTTPPENPTSPSNASLTPLEDTIRHKLLTNLSPTTLTISNDSAAHAHHTAMRGTTSLETHFRLLIVSDAFQAKPQPARHRMVYRILGDELKMEGGVHALQLVTRTVEEEGRKRGEMGRAGEKEEVKEGAV